MYGTQVLDLVQNGWLAKIVTVRVSWNADLVNQIV